MKIIETYIDKCIELSNLYKEYLGYLPFYEGIVVKEMHEDLNTELFKESPESVFIKQGTDEINVFKFSDKDTFWKEIENTISDEEIKEFENHLGIVLPKSYKKYLKYKHFYQIFWDINIVLFAKPLKEWSEILVYNNEEMKEFVLEKGYLGIGLYNDYGVIGLKLGNNENEELEISLIDYETGEFSNLANNFSELLEKTLKLEQPKIENLKEWQKNMKAFNR